MVYPIGLLTLVLVLYWMFFRQIFHSVAAPASIWLLGWSLLFGACAALGWDYIYRWAGVTVLFLGVLVFPIGCLFSSRPASRQTSRDVTGSSSSFAALIRFSPAIQLAAAAVGFVGAVALSHHFGRSLLGLASFAELSLAAHATGKLIESGEEVMPTFSSIAFAVVQVGFMCSGFFVAMRGFRVKPVALLVALLGVVALWTVVTTIRSYFVASVIWFISSYVAAKILARQEQGLINPRIVLGSMLGVTGLVALVIVSQSYRMGDYHFKLVGAAAAHLRPWVAAYIPGFSCWYDEMVRNPGGDMGGTSIFRGLLAAMGIVSYEPFNRATTLIPVGAGQTTNAITIFNTIVGDFGLIGGMLFTFVSGYLSQTAYELCRRGSLVGLATYSAVVAAILWSPNAWFFKYGSRMFASALLLFLLIAIKFVIDTQRKNARLRSA